MSSEYKRTICYIWEILGVIRTMEINQQSLRNNVVPFYNRRPSVYLNQFSISCLQYSYNNVIHISNEVSYDDLDPEASIGAVRHEYRHMLDDFVLGHPGMRVIADSDLFWRLEYRGYMKK